MAPSLTDGLTWYGVFLLSTICHEAAHAWTALKLGDPTAARGGQVSLNPWPHLRREPFGMIVVPLFTLFAAGTMIGWASAPYDPDWARANPRRAGFMALAGPAANALLVLVGIGLIALGLRAGVFVPPPVISPMRLTDAAVPACIPAARFLGVLVSLNLLLGLFNLVPVPPLDGGSLPLILLPARAAARYAGIMRSPVLRMAGFLAAALVLRTCLFPLLADVAAILYPNLEYR